MLIGAIACNGLLHREATAERGRGTAAGGGGGGRHSELDE
jgi:hypothetical protein